MSINTTNRELDLRLMNARAERLDAEDELPGSIWDLMKLMYGPIRCFYEDGKECPSDLEPVKLAYVTPLEMGGTNTPCNIQLLCTYHHRMFARRDEDFRPERIWPDDLEGDN